MAYERNPLELDKRQENFHASWLQFERPSLHHSPRILSQPTAHFNNYCRPHVDMDKDLDMNMDMDTDTDKESESELVMCSIFRILHIRRPERGPDESGFEWPPASCNNIKQYI